MVTGDTLPLSTEPGPVRPPLLQWPPGTRMAPSISAPMGAPGPAGRSPTHPRSSASAAAPLLSPGTSDTLARRLQTCVSRPPRGPTQPKPHWGGGGSAPPLPCPAGFLFFCCLSVCFFVCLDDPYVGSKKLKHFILVVSDHILLGSGDSSPHPCICGHVECHRLYIL